MVVEEEKEHDMRSGPLKVEISAPPRVGLGVSLKIEHVQFALHDLSMSCVS